MKKVTTEKRKKVNHMISKIKYYGDPYQVGQLALQVRLVIFNIIAIPTLFTNIETWSRINAKEVEQLEKIQKDVLTDILELPKSTPYRGLLSELGIWPVEQLMEYKRMTLLQQIIQSDEKRMLKEIIEEQIKCTWTGCWMQKTNEICDKYNIQIDEVRKMEVNKFKTQIKNRINTKLNEEIQKLSKERTKLRFCDNAQRKEYIDKLGYMEAKAILKLRLNMIEVKSNYKGQYKDVKCQCQESEDTTEHLFSCKEIKNVIKDIPEVENIKKEDKESCTQLANFVKKALHIKGIDINKRVKENIGVNFDDTTK